MIVDPAAGGDGSTKLEWHCGYQWQSQNAVQKPMRVVTRGPSGVACSGWSRVTIPGWG